MLNIDRVYQRLTTPDKRGQIAVPELAGKPITDLRLLRFTKDFILPAGGSFAVPVVVGPQPLQFAGGAIVVHIGGDAIPDGQPVNPFLTGNERYEVQMDYTQGDKLLTGPTGGFTIAAELFGRNGELSTFPEKELYFPPQQNVFIQVRTRLPEQLYVTLGFAALVWRFAQ